MAAYLNPMNSVMGGDDPGIWGSSLAVGQMGDARSVSDSSPLQIFVRAKKKINNFFVKIENYVHDTVTWMQSVQQDGTIVKPEDAVQVKGYIDKVTAIRNILTRDHMKVAFFGRTSNGKSSVINAMLHEKILPSGYGHTTNCFVQVEGSDSEESYLVTEGSTEKQNVKSVGQLAHALCKEKLGESQLVHIYWPQDKCLLLKYDVVIVDSPGTDMSFNFNEGINRYCLDADIFVFVLNAESTLTLAEKNFFQEVSAQLSKPYIFLLYNRWDVVASEPDFLDQVQAQHMEQAVKFLVTELNVCTHKEANQRIFFVSAKEALQARQQEQKGQPAHSGALAEGFQNRYFEFQDFERKFEECISKSAVRTKFEQHSQRGQLIVSEIRQIMDSTYKQAKQLKTQKAVAKKEIHDKLNCTKKKLLLLTQEMKDRIQQMVEDVTQRVSEALSEEISCLSVLVDEFNLPFNPEQRVLDVYKKELYHHVENVLVSKLCERLSTALAVNIENSQREMTEEMSGLLPAEKKHASLNTLPQREPFEILYRLNCDKLFAAFHEDVGFRFLWERYRGPKDFDFKILMQDARPFWSRLGHMMGKVSMGSRIIQYGLMAAGTMVAVGAGAVGAGAVGVLALRGAVVEACVVGAPAGAIVFGGVSRYIYERITWTNTAKEEEFKHQFVDHVTKNLQVIVDRISADCSNQVEQELSSTLEQLRDLVNEATKDMDAEIKTLDEEIKQLEEAANSAKGLRNKANYIANELEMFDDEFLKLPN